MFNIKSLTDAALLTRIESNAQRVVGWGLAPLPSAAAFFLTGLDTWWIFAVLGVITLLVFESGAFLGKTLRPYALAFAYVFQCILLTSAFAGHAWQLDTHMMFFAILAIISTLQSPGALLFGTALIAVHHVSLNLVMPGIVFPASSVQASLERAGLHAAVVLLEVSILLISMTKRTAAETAFEEQKAVAEQKTEAAELAEHLSKQARDDAETVTNALEGQLVQLSSGRLDCAILDPFPERYEPLRASFNDAVAKLGATLQEVTQTAVNITDQLSQMERSSSDLSQRTETQAATLEQTAAAMEEISKSVVSATQEAKTADESTGRVRNDAQESGKIVQGAVAAMTKIEGSSNQISTIINVIDDIAFQTNLLALNAGVEAARAGDAGRGFAVVATEVRALATRSAEAATQIKSLIEESADQVSSGVGLVVKAGTAIDAIVQEFNEISGAISQIAHRSEEQSHTLAEINLGVGQLDGVTQKNAAMVNELSSHGATLGSDAERLKNLMQAFVLPVSRSRLAA